MSYDPEKHRRRSIRLPEYDYRQAGGYFVAICVQDHVCLFGEVVDGRMQLNACGRIARTCWKAVPDHFPHVQLDAFVVMPNHVHGIVIITAGKEERDTAEDDRRGTACRAPTTHEGLPSSNDETRSFGRPMVGSLPTVVRSYKSAVTRVVRRGVLPGFQWQRNYYEHVIRGRRDIERIHRYIEENPAWWGRDRYYVHQF